MGRTFENRKQAILKRGARDARAFTKAGRQIAIAVKSGGPDEDANPTLRRAIQNARAVNMPKDKIKYAIDKASGANQGDDFGEVLYEGYGPHGVALLVDALTDNPTRTVANVRSHFKKGGGSLGNSGSVAFLFEQYGYFLIEPEAVDRDSLELELIDHGLEELNETTDDDGKPLLSAWCSRDSFGAMQLALESREVSVNSSGFLWSPSTQVAVSVEAAEEITALIERLEDDDDVQKVFSNAEWPD
ncbi:MAG: YebC/PmpR family DNA-binding transcriptional regulator [Myxococcota bacterium]